MYAEDAVEVLERAIKPESLDRVQIYFPDPWHKKRHHKRRLIQTEFVNLLSERMRVGGLLHLATDWKPYAEHMLEVLEASAALTNKSGVGNFADKQSGDLRPSLNAGAWRPRRMGSALCQTVAVL